MQRFLRKTFAKRIWWYMKRGSRSWPQRFHPRNAKKCTSTPYDERPKKNFQSSLWDWQIISNRHISIDTGSTGEHSCSLSTAMWIVKNSLSQNLVPSDLSQRPKHMCSEPDTKVSLAVEKNQTGRWLTILSKGKISSAHVNKCNTRAQLYNNTHESQPGRNPCPIACKTTAKN